MGKDKAKNEGMNKKKDKKKYKTSEYGGVFEIPDIPKSLEMVKVRQVFGESPCFDVESQLRLAASDNQGLLDRLGQGDTVGIAVGSRGIAGLDEVVKAVAGLVKERGGVPSVFSAMGGHGGTEEGQLEILAGFGITPEALGIPVVASAKCEMLTTIKDRMEETRIGNSGREEDEEHGPEADASGSQRSSHSQEVPVFVNSLALEFDWIIPVNRVKLHTSFTGEIESGLTKMLAVGIGGSEGARVAHSRGAQAIGEMVELLGPAVGEHLPILMGVALVEDKSHKLKTLRLCSREEFPRVDRELLEEARSELPRLPFDEIDVLVVNKMGKCFSGTGMDTNVIGRIGIRGVPEEGLKAKYIVVLDLAEESGGNANGIGLADITTEGLVKKMDYPLTLKNVLTTSFLDRAKIPVTFAQDREAIAAAIGLVSYSSGKHGEPEELGKLRLVNIDNTLELEEFYVSVPLADAGGIEIVSRGHRMVFDDQGKFIGY